MLANKWKQAVERSGMSQNKLAGELGLSSGEFSRICRGEIIPEPVVLDMLCRKFSIVPLDVYREETLKVMYQSEASRLILGWERDTRPNRRIRISAASADVLDAYVDRGMFASAKAAMEHMIWSYRP